MRNLLTCVPRERAELRGDDGPHDLRASPKTDIIASSTTESSTNSPSRFPEAAALLDHAEPNLLALTAFAKEHWRQFWSNNSLERLTRRSAAALAWSASFLRAFLLPCAVVVAAFEAVGDPASFCRAFAALTLLGPVLTASAGTPCDPMAAWRPRGRLPMTPRRSTAGAVLAVKNDEWAVASRRNLNIRVTRENTRRPDRQIGP
jgi:hypothetical protein